MNTVSNLHSQCPDSPGNRSLTGSDKVLDRYEEALNDLEDNMSAIQGRFDLRGTTKNLIKEIKCRGSLGLKVVTRML